MTIHKELLIYAIFSVLVSIVTITLIGCSDADATDEAPVIEEQKPQLCQLVQSPVKYVHGTRCPKGMLTDGHVLGTNGGQVSGCYTLSIKCGG